MKIFKKILCPVDFSEYSILALRYASALARDNDAELIVYHSIPDLTPAISYLEGEFLLTVSDALINNAKSTLESWVKKYVDTDLAVEKIIGQGNPAESIVDTSRKHKVDLLVMGTHGVTGYERFLMGSVTNRVLHKSSVPVLVVSKTSHHFIYENDQNPVQIKRIVCPLDFDNNNLWTIGIALSFARKYDSEMIFLHVINRKQNGNWRDLEKHALSKLKALAAPVVDENIPVKFLVVSGDPADVVLKTLDEQNADLVIMGHHTRNPIEEIFLGSIARRVVTNSSRPILVARTLMDTLKETPAIQQVSVAG
jgi:nucleotide-binding universal stress UspA family protein